MKIDANSIRVGNVLEHETRLWVVLKTMHTQPGKGGAYMQVEMKDIKNGTKQNIRFRSSETVEKAQIDEIEYQYLYSQSGQIILMNLSTFEQIEVGQDLFPEEQIPFLCEGITVKVSSYSDDPIMATLPEKIETVIAECEPSIKGQTATNSFKSAILKNGVRIMVPPFINLGEKIIINVNTREYSERAK